MPSLTRPKTLPALAVAAAAMLAAVSLSGCQSTVSKADASSLSSSFCGTWLPGAAPIVGNLNAQLRADFQTVTAACTATANGKSINPVTVAIAALALYEGVSATYQKLAALSDHDLATAHRLIDGARIGAYLGAR